MPRNAGGSKMLLVGGTVLACFFMLAAALYFFRMKRTEAAWFAIALLVLISSFVGVYAAFYGQAGLPAGEGLSSADWLSFLGGYLGFAGSLIMAWLVYRQDTKLKELTMEEYKPAFYSCIRGVMTVTDTVEGREKVFTTVEDGEKTKKIYFTNDAFPVNMSKKMFLCTEEHMPVICFTIENAGKLSAEKLRFDELKISPYGSKNAGRAYRFEEKTGGNLLSGRHELLPGKALNFCVAMHLLPDRLEFSLAQLSFSFEMKEERTNETIQFYIEKHEEKIFVSDGEHLYKAIS